MKPQKVPRLCGGWNDGPGLQGLFSGRIQGKHALLGDQRVAIQGILRIRAREAETRRGGVEEYRIRAARRGRQEKEKEDCRRRRPREEMPHFFTSRIVSWRLSPPP